MAQIQLERGRKMSDSDTDDPDRDGRQDSSDEDFYPGNYLRYGVIGKWQRQGYIPVPINKSSPFVMAEGIRIGRILTNDTKEVSLCSNTNQSEVTSGFSEKNKALFEQQIHLNDTGGEGIPERLDDVNREMAYETDTGTESRRNKAFKMKITRRRSSVPDEHDDFENTWSIAPPETTTDKELMHRDYVGDVLESTVVQQGEPSEGRNVITCGLQDNHQNSQSGILAFFNTDISNSISSLMCTSSLASDNQDLNKELNPTINEEEVAKSAMMYLQNIESAVSQLNPVPPVTLNIATKRKTKSSKNVDKKIIRFVNGEKWRECGKCGKLVKTRKAMREHNKIHREEEQELDPDLKIIDGKRWRECSVCGKMFHTRKELRIHFRTHTNEKPYECSVCGKGFKQLAHMNSHMKIHSGEKPHTCDICGMNFTERSSLKRHIRRHLGIKPFKCTLCPNEYYTSTLLKAHMESHLIKKGEMERFVCEICKKSYSRKETLNAHLKTHDPERQIRCETCDMVFLTQSHLRRHRLKHLEKSDDTFVCGVCDRRFTTAYNLQKHMRRHTQPKRFHCDVCDREFADKCTLIRHKLVHDPYKDEKRTFPCSICPKTFFTRGNLTEHMKSHSDERPFQCEICKKEFKRKWQYTIHLKNHQEKPYKCELCSSSYAFRKGLTLHVQKQHQTECTDGDKPLFSCDQCPKTFSLSSSLRSHKKIHTEHALKCDDCDKLFYCKSSLARHKISHTKDRPCRCHLCPKSFKFMANFRQHLLMTHNILPMAPRSFKCPHCENLFSMKGSFITHLKFYHGFVENTVLENCVQTAEALINEQDESKFDAFFMKAVSDSKEAISTGKQSACALSDDTFVKDDVLLSTEVEGEYALHEGFLMEHEEDFESERKVSDYDTSPEPRDSVVQKDGTKTNVGIEGNATFVYKVQDQNDDLSIKRKTDCSLYVGNVEKPLELDYDSETTELDNDTSIIVYEESDTDTDVDHTEP